VVLSLAMAGLGLSAIRARHLAEARRADAEGLMSFMLGDFADKLRPLGRLALLDSVSAKALQFLSNTEQDDLGPAALTQRAKALQVIAEVRVARGQTAEALAVLAAAQKILDQQFASDPKDEELIKELGINAFWQGRIQSKQSNWNKAERYFSEYQRYAKMRYDLDPGNADAWVELSYADVTVGSMAMKRSRPEEAEREFNASIALKLRALEIKRGDRVLSGDLANTLSWLASSDEMAGNLNQALLTLKREQDVLSRLSQAEPNDLLWIARTASSVQQEGKLRYVLGQEEAGLDDLTRSENLLVAAVAREPDNIDWRARLAIVRLDRLQAQAKYRDPAARLSELHALMDTVDSLTKLDPKNSEWLHLRTLTNQAIASALLQLGQTGEARIQLTEAINQLGAMNRANPVDLHTLSDLAKGWLIMSQIDASIRNRSQQIQACDRARDLVASVARGSNDYRLLDPWVRAETCLGNYAIVATAKSRLQQMGYHESTYMQFLSTETNHKD